MASLPSQAIGSQLEPLASLGPPEQSYPSSKVVQFLGWGAGICALAFAGFLFFAAVVPFGSNAPPPFTLYLLGGAFAFAGVVLIGVTIYNSGLKYLVYREGFAQIHFGKCIFIPWKGPGRAHQQW